MLSASWGRVVALTLGVCAVDRVTKLVAAGRLAEGQSIPLIPDIFHLTLVFNTGGAFGLLKDQRLFFIPFALAAIACIIYCLYRYRPTGILMTSAFGLIMGGAFGNLIDRVRYGYVIDFFDFRVWPVFNVADSAITIGAVLLVVSVLTRHARGAAHT